MAVFKCKKKCFHNDQLFVPGDELVAASAPKHFVCIKEDKKEDKVESSLEEILGTSEKVSKKVKGLK